MISKSEFLSRVKMQIFPKLDEKKFQLRKRRRMFFFMAYLSVLLYFFLMNEKIPFPDFWNAPSDLLQGYFIVLVLSLAFVYMRSSSDEKGNAIEIECKLFDLLGLQPSSFYEYEPQESKYDAVKGVFIDDGLKYDEIFEKKMEEKNNLLEKSFLFRKKLKNLSVFCDTSLEFDTVRVFECGFSLPNGKNRSTFFNGLFIEIKQNSFYEEPIVFVKRAMFNGRKELRKVNLPRMDKYFDIYSNDVPKAQNLYYQQIANKLLFTKDVLKVKKVEASFYQDRLFIALYTNKNFFEPVQGTLLNVELYEQFYDEIAEVEKYCKQFVDL